MEKTRYNRNNNILYGIGAGTEYIVITEMPDGDMEGYEK